MGVGFLEAVQEEEASLDDARRTIMALKERQKIQAKISLAWKIKYRTENRCVMKLKKERDGYLKSFQSQLFLFESCLKKSKLEFENLVKHKDDIINRQHQLLCNLALALVKRKGQEDLKRILPGIKIEQSSLDSPPSENSSDSESKNNSKNNNRSINEDSKKEMIIMTSSKNDLESLNDSDSAIMMEDAYDSLVVLPGEKGEVKVMRSVSDALEIISRSSSSNNKGNQNATRRHLHGSISSTPSGSSEDSDGSPPSTMTKGRSEHLRIDEKDNFSNSFLPSTPLIMSPLLPSVNFCQSCNANCKCSSSCRLHSIAKSNIEESSIHICETSDCQQCYHSGSTTPVQSPYSSMTTTPSASPTAVHSSATQNVAGQTSYDSDTTLSDGESEDEDEAVRLHDHFHQMNSERKSVFGSYEKLHNLGISYVKKKPKDEMTPVVYNRVMSNHRSVTKPKDVKYKRINKAKSRSLEELRGKLKLWDEKQPISPDIGYSEA